MSAPNPWKDITSYSRNDAERIPSVFEATDGNLRICVLNSHRDYRPAWVMHCAALCIDTLPLHAKTESGPKREALRTVLARIEGLRSSAVLLTSISNSYAPTEDNDR